MEEITINIEWSISVFCEELSITQKDLGFTSEEWEDMSEADKKVWIRNYLSENKQELLDGLDLELESFEEV